MYMVQTYNEIFSFLSSRILFADMINDEMVEEILMGNEDMYKSYFNLSDVNRRRLINDVKNECCY